MKKKIFITLCIIVLLFSCKTTPPAPKIEGLETSSSFMQANIPLISEYSLDNGIKVIVKKQDTNRVFTMSVVYSGGLALIPQGKDGLESLTLSMMLRGSKKYSYEEIKRISSENSSAMSASTGIDLSWLNLTTIDKYWNQMLDVFTDSIMNPVFDEKELELVKKAALMDIKKRMSDPYDFTVTKLHEKIFKDHPYSIEKDGTESSVSTIKIEDLKQWYAEKLTADRMFIVAVGNFNPSSLISQLNKTIGKIPVKQNKIPEVKKLDIKQNLFTEAFEESKGIAYIRGDYIIPPVQSKDFTTLRFTYTILNELLFEIVRTQNAACYSVWTNAHGFNSTYGSLVVFKSDKPTKAKTAFDEAIAVLASGQTINLKGQGIKSGEGSVTKSSGNTYAPIAENLEAYKSKFINGFFGNQLTNSDAAAQIMYSQAYYGNPYEYLRMIDKINAITSEDIIRVTNDYIVNGKVSWMVVADSATLSKLDKSKFMKFTGNVKK